jgi:hypothetical protein
MDTTRRVARPLLGFREVEVPARMVAFEVLVAEIHDAAAGVYMLGQELVALKEEEGGRAAIALAGLIERRCELLQRLVEQREGGGDG